MGGWEEGRGGQGWGGGEGGGNPPGEDTGPPVAARWSRPRGPTLTEISYALPEIDFEIMKSEALEIRNHFHFKIYSVKSRKLLHTSRDQN